MHIKVINVIGSIGTYVDLGTHMFSDFQLPSICFLWISYISSRPTWNICIVSFEASHI